MVGPLNRPATSFNSQAAFGAVGLAASHQLPNPSLNHSLGRSSRNGTLATATSIGPFPGKVTVKDTIGPGNPADFMRVELSETSRMRLVLSNRSDNRLSAALLDATGNLAKIRNGKSILAVAAGEQNETVFKGVKPGTYYLRVQLKTASRASRYEANLFVNRTAGPAPLPCDCGL